jgi:hypothetical protein
MTRAIVRASKPAAPLFLVEYPAVPIEALQKMTQRQAVIELGVAGLRCVETKDLLPTQHFVVLEKPVSPANP